MHGLTARQREILEFIGIFSTREGMAPTVEEIAAQFGLRGPTVFAHLKALRNKNFLSRSGKARSLRVRNYRRGGGGDAAYALPIPLVGRTADTGGGVVYYDGQTFEGGDAVNLFAFKLETPPPPGCGLLVGDCVVARRLSRETAVDADEWLILELPDGGGLRVVAAPGADAKVVGALVGVQRRYESPGNKI